MIQIQSLRALLNQVLHTLCAILRMLSPPWDASNKCWSNPPNYQKLRTSLMSTRERRRKLRGVGGLINLGIVEQVVPVIYTRDALPPPMKVWMRLIAGGVAAGCLAVLVIGGWLRPNGEHGISTHTQ